jgi:hypothetical protein
LGACLREAASAKAGSEGNAQIFLVFFIARRGAQLFLSFLFNLPF